MVNEPPCTLEERFPEIAHLHSHLLAFSLSLTDGNANGKPPSELVHFNICIDPPHHTCAHSVAQLEGGGSVLLLPGSGNASASGNGAAKGSPAASSGDKGDVSALDLLDAVPVLPSHIQSGGLCLGRQ